jgi:DNA-binding MarR family transcriptional regulator
MSVSADAPAGVAPLATVLLARVARAVRQQFEAAVRPLGLRQRQIVALGYLRGHGPTAQQRLAEQLCMDPSSLVCLLNDLEERDLVVRQRDRSDRRRGLIALSKRGELALAAVDQALARVEDAILCELDGAERCLLRDLLARLGTAAPRWELDDAEPFAGTS